MIITRKIRQLTFVLDLPFGWSICSTSESSLQVLIFSGEVCSRLLLGGLPVKSITSFTSLRAFLWGKVGDGDREAVVLSFLRFVGDF